MAIGTTTAGVDLSHMRQDTAFDAYLRPDRGPRYRDLQPMTPPAEQYTAATADIWVKR